MEKRKNDLRNKESIDIVSKYTHLEYTQFNLSQQLYLSDFSKIVGNFQPKMHQVTIPNTGVKNMMLDFSSEIAKFSKRVNSVTSSLQYFRTHLVNIIAFFNKEKKYKLAYCLKYDFYPPLLFLDNVFDMSDFSSQKEADEFILQLMDLWKREFNKTVYDFIPLSLKTYYEIDQLKALEELKMYKTIVLFCLERIENILIKLQLTENVNKKNIKTSNGAINQLLSKDNVNDNFLLDLINQISSLEEINCKLNLYKRFDELDKLYSEEGVLPLGRNFFFHGFVSDEEVTYLLAQKAILAYAFFKQLYYLKSLNSVRKRQLLTRRIGQSTMRKHKVRNRLRTFKRKE